MIPSTTLSRCLVLAAGAVSCMAHAGRPLATDDAAVIDKDACQLETWTERSRARRGNALTVGCNPWGQTELAVGAASGKDDGMGSSAMRNWQIKQMLPSRPDGPARFAVAVGGDRQHGGDGRSLFVTGLASIATPHPSRTVHVNLGVLRQSAGAAKRKATWGIALDTTLGSRTGIAIEGFGTSGEPMRWQTGVRYAIKPGTLQLDGSIGSALGRGRDSYVFTLGLVFVRPAML